MSEPESDSANSPLVEEHPEVVDDIAEMWEPLRQDPDAEDLSDDFAMQIFRDASERCGRAGIPREERPDVIMAGVRKFLREQMEQDLQDIRWQLEMMFQL